MSDRAVTPQEPISNLQITFQGERRLTDPASAKRSGSPFVSHASRCGEETVTRRHRSSAGVEKCTDGLNVFSPIYVSMHSHAGVHE